MRWPDEWQDPSAIEFVKGSVVTCFLASAAARAKLGPVVSRAEAEGLKFAEETAPPAGVVIVKADWPEQRPVIRRGRGGAGAQATGQAAAQSEDAIEAGPTGVPWVDSIGWVVQLGRVKNPNSLVWVDAPPRGTPVRPEAYVRAVADAAANGGRWVVCLDKGLAAGMRDRDAQSLETWKGILRACDFFQSHDGWRDYTRVARLAVVSDFQGPNEFLSTEILNVAARNNQPVHILEKAKLTDAQIRGLNAVIHMDGDTPEPALRRKLLAYANAGGLLVVGQKWGKPEGTLTRDTYMQFSIYATGRGRLAVANDASPDPYVVVRDVPVLVSHRYDLVRVYVANAGIMYYSVAPGGKQGLVQIVNFVNQGGFRRGDSPITAQVAERYRTARLVTIEQPEPKPVETGYKMGNTQFFLPPVPVYAAVELRA